MIKGKRLAMDLSVEFFNVKKKEYDKPTLSCIQEAVQRLEEIGDQPLMMLGKIQSGKTRSFIGVISLAFDTGYDLAIVLTKNSNALAKQTVARMRQEFNEFKDDDIIDIFDIMCIPSEMSRFELNKKLIIVVKKEKNNLPKMIQFIQKYALYEEKKCLIIDDEADFCSIGFEKNKNTEDFDLRKIASQINDLRLQLTCKFVQVTATPYALYLQPENIDLGNDKTITPIKPAATVLVPYGAGYIGGEYYFNHDQYPLGEYLFHAIEKDELGIIKSSDRRKFKLEDVLLSDKITGLRKAIMNFIVGGCIRIIQNGGSPRGKKNKFSFIMHTETSKVAHNRQEEIISALIERLEEEVRENSTIVKRYIYESYNELNKSVQAYGFKMPFFEKVESMVHEAINNQWITKAIVNSENDIDTLLDDDGQLRLRTPLNIFIGGQILDRGITISNLIGFYYGRAPQKMQQDTVLQHARMYGYRKKDDLAITRFYTTREIYQRMTQINEFDSKLREDFEQGNFDQGIIFISRDENGKIVPCSPNKIMISNTHVLKPGKTTTPVGFQTGYKIYISQHVEKIDDLLRSRNNGKLDGTYSVPKEVAIEVIHEIYQTLEIENEKCISEAAFISLINYLAKTTVHIYCGTNREISRLRSTSRYYSDMPYNRDRDLIQAKDMAVDEPTLMLMKQNGQKDKGWRGAEFYWPVLVTPQNIPTAVYTSELLG